MFLGSATAVEPMTVWSLRLRYAWHCSRDQPQHDIDLSCRGLVILTDQVIIRFIVIQPSSYAGMGYFAYHPPRPFKYFFTAYPPGALNHTRSRTLFTFHRSTDRGRSFLQHVHNQPPTGQALNINVVIAPVLVHIRNRLQRLLDSAVTVAVELEGKDDT